MSAYAARTASPRRTPPWRGAAISAPVAGLVLAVSLGVFLLVRGLVGFSSIDLLVYRVEGLAVRSHLDLYGALPTPHGLQATYPPFAALVFVPLSWVPAGWLPLLGLAANVLLLLLVVRLALRFGGWTPGATSATAATLLVSALMLWAEPVFLTLRNGQINLALLALVLWDVNRAGRSRWTGVGIGVAAGLKVTPAIFIGYLLLTRRFRAAAVASAAFAGTLAVSAAVLPSATWRFWSSIVFDSSRVGDVDATGNQSLYGAIARITHSRAVTPVETVLVAAAALAGIACAVLAARRLGDAWGVAACSVTALLVAPIAWSHHWVWVVPVAVLLWQQARAWLVPLAVIFGSQVIWLLPHGSSADELAFSPSQVAVSCLYAAAGGAFLVAVAWRALAAGRRQDRTGDPCACGPDADAGGAASTPARSAGGFHP